MTIFLAILFCSGLFANSFDLKDTPNRFSLVINSRTLTYLSAKKNIETSIRPCNLPLVRALNAELMAQVPMKETLKGLAFMVDGNSYRVSPQRKEARLLISMDQRMVRFQGEEKKACAL